MHQTVDEKHLQTQSLKYTENRSKENEIVTIKIEQNDIKEEPHCDTSEIGKYCNKLYSLPKQQTQH